MRAATGRRACPPARRRAWGGKKRVIDDAAAIFRAKSRANGSVLAALGGAAGSRPSRVHACGALVLACALDGGLDGIIHGKAERTETKETLTDATAAAQTREGECPSDTRRHLGRPRSTTSRLGCGTGGPHGCPWETTVTGTAGNHQPGGRRLFSAVATEQARGRPVGEAGAPFCSLSRRGSRRPGDTGWRHR